jgi:PBP1b-binding outer membrane lipoprotein LpoB
MKTMTKKLVLAAFVATGLAGCAEDNEKAVMKDDTGKQTKGVNPPNVKQGKAGSADFMKNNAGAMQSKENQAGYRDAVK